MAKYDRYVCDRCGKGKDFPIIENPDYYIIELAPISQGMTGGVHIFHRHLCPKCAKQFEKWLNGEVEES